MIEKNTFRLALAVTLGLLHAEAFVADGAWNVDADGLTGIQFEAALQINHILYGLCLSTVALAKVDASVLKNISSLRTLSVCACT